METTFLDEAKLKTNEELKEITINFEIYRGAIVAAAKQELSNRGIELSIEEKEIIDKKKLQRKQDAIAPKKSSNSWDWFNVKWKINIVDSSEAPQLYSRQVINIFSILFSVLFGGILLAINLNTINKKKGIFPVLAFSLAYTVLMAVGLKLIGGRSSAFTIVLNILGATILYNTFWAKYIGKSTEYRTKPFWIPLIIGILIFSFFLWVIIVGGQI
jgi:hypothetical protein